MRVRYTRQGLSDLHGIGAYIRERNPSAAADLEIAIRSTIDLLADFPKLGLDRPELDARAIPSPPTTESSATKFGSSIFATTGEIRPSVVISEACDMPDPAAAADGAGRAFPFSCCPPAIGASD